MSDASILRVTEGDQVRVHYHPPGPVMSFVEGVVRCVDMKLTEGGGFLIDITRDVLLGQEQPVTSSFQHYVPLTRSDDFPRRVEVLSRAERQFETQAP
jgi:hypothetical protein